MESPRTAKIAMLLGIIVAIGSVIPFTPTKGFTGNREPITIGAERSPLLALVMIAEDQGLFPKQGVDVMVKYYTTGKLALTGSFGKTLIWLPYWLKIWDGSRRIPARLNK
jgi:ABC-type nitrate/sulfonate/bicarbonate transport system substrate-binding protein